MKANQILLRTLSLSLPIALGLGGATSSAYAYDQPASRIERAPPIDRRPSRSDHPVVGRPVDRNRDGFVAKRDLLASRRLEALADARRIDFNRDGWLSPVELRRAGRFNVGSM